MIKHVFIYRKGNNIRWNKTKMVGYKIYMLGIANLAFLNVLTFFFLLAAVLFCLSARFQLILECGLFVLRGQKGFHDTQSYPPHCFLTAACGDRFTGMMCVP